MLGSLLSLLTTRVLGFALAGSIVVGGIATGYEGLCRAHAEKTAERAQAALAQAIAQTAVLSATLATQNAAVDALKSTLASREAAVSAAQAQVAQLSKVSASRAAALKAATVPAECPGAVGWLEDQLGSAGE